MDDGAEQEYVRTSEIPVSAGAAFDWHLRPGAFDRLTPPWEPAELVRREGSIRDGDLTEIALRAGPFALRWVAEHEGFEDRRRFVDVQRRGPFAAWRHEHLFEPLAPDRFRMTDRVRYRLPGGALGAALAGRAVRRKLDRMFAYRHATLADDLRRHAETQAGAEASTTALRVAVSGAGGLIGRALCAVLETGGHRVVRLVRRAPRPAAAGEECRWDVRRGLVDPGPEMQGLDAVVHLAAAGIADRRWTRARMREIEESRVAGTRALARSLAALDAPPRALLSASAIGIYGAADGFLAGVARRWEESAATFAAPGRREVRLRIGNVLTPRGGLLAPLLPWFRVGLGGTAGDGSAPLSWISIDDAVWAIHRLLADDAVEGPVDLVSPAPDTFAGLARALGRTLGRPAALRAPAALVRAAFGRMADETVLDGVRVEPRALLRMGYRFRDAELEPALCRLLGQGRRP